MAKTGRITAWTPALNLQAANYKKQSLSKPLVQLVGSLFILYGTYRLTHVQTCDIARVQSAMQWTASVHTWKGKQPSHVKKIALFLSWMLSGSLMPPQPSLLCDLQVFVLARWCRISSINSIKRTLEICSNRAHHCYHPTPTPPLKKTVTKMSISRFSVWKTPWIFQLIALLLSFCI